MSEHKPMSEVLAGLTGQVCTQCGKNYTPRKASLCDECRDKALPVAPATPPHPYWCDCELCEEEAKQSSKFPA